MVRGDTVATNARLEMSAAQSVVDDAAAATPGDPFHNLGAYIPGDRRRALAQGTPMPDRVRGAALFADISGFTPLTEALAKELGPQRGAEELTAQLNRVFHALITDLARYGGHVIYFSGDAITCWIDGDDGLRATACALAMQATIGQFGDVVTPAGMKVRLAMKVAVSVGAARRFLVGDPSVQRIDVLAGRLIDELAGAEHQAEKGEVVLDRSALEALGDRVEIREMRVEEDGWREFGVVDRLTVPVEVAPAPAQDNPLPEAVAREWLLPDIFERLRAGHGEFLAELRPAYPVFLRFGGIDYDDERRCGREARRLHPRGTADSGVVRRQPAASDAGRQGRVSVRRVRLPARSRGRRGARGSRGARAASAPGHDRREEHPDRHHVRSAAQRYLWPQATGRHSPASEAR